MHHPESEHRAEEIGSFAQYELMRPVVRGVAIHPVQASLDVMDTAARRSPRETAPRHGHTVRGSRLRKGGCGTGVLHRGARGDLT
ncbi:hypothetical protein B1H18_13360 [Streptomyces tsukubensis]|uniref:Uncharacterized protein n=1 Tax=Streptomyces tsukubensis TaxID=83656 RepID=A0A1V4AAP8_9ACTN|nr:hypothetical protein B1H18_13360 [Streptomyces tsukubensis]